MPSGKEAVRAPLRRLTSNTAPSAAQGKGGITKFLQTSHKATSSECGKENESSGHEGVKHVKPAPGSKANEKALDKELAELRTRNESNVACIKDLNNIIGDYRKANDELRQALKKKGIDQLNRQLEEKEAEIDERDAALLQYHDHAQEVQAELTAKLDDAQQTIAVQQRIIATAAKMRTRCRALQHELMDCLRELRTSLSEAGRAARVTAVQTRIDTLQAELDADETLSGTDDTEAVARDGCNERSGIKRGEDGEQSEPRKKHRS